MDRHKDRQPEGWILFSALTTIYLTLFNLFQAILLVIVALEIYFAKLLKVDLELEDGEDGDGHDEDGYDTSLRMRSVVTSTNARHKRTKTIQTRNLIFDM